MDSMGIMVRKQTAADQALRLDNQICFAVYSTAHAFNRVYKPLLDRLGLTPRFAAICGQDTFGVAKPDPAFLRETVARAGGKLPGAIMVGDAGPDVGVARRASVPVIGVDFGYTDVPMTELKPDRLISHMRDLPDAVASLGAA